jgi:triosephosphate isomerase
MRKFVIGGNWKMQITSVKESVKVAKDISKAIESESIQNVDVYIAPCYNALYSVGKAIKGTNLKLAAQNVHYHEKGAFTGEISINSLIEAGCEYVLIGHSERRRIFNETDALINKKVLIALEKGLKVVLCIGETAKEREQGRTAEVNKEQLAGSLKDVTTDQLSNVIIAYEPVWAINNKFLNPGIEIKAATPNQAKEAHNMVREWFKDKFGSEVANKIQITYGGSMKPSNCDELLNIEDIDGGLIGGASLKVETFLPIIKSAVKQFK